MVRQNRKETEYQNAFYHIVIKGIEGMNIFTDDIDRKKFLFYLQKMSNLYKIQIFSYVLMNTYYHLLLKTEEANLSQAMQFLNSSYAHWYNIRHIRKGHLFQDRYKSYLTLNPLYLYNIASYISLNPVEAGLVNSPEEFTWSSFRFLFSSQAKNTPTWLHLQEFLQLCQTNSNNFINFVKENCKKNNFENVFQNSINDSPRKIQCKLSQNIDFILKKVKEHIGDIEINKHLKYLVIYLLINEGYKPSDIASSLKMTKPAILKIKNKFQKILTTDYIYRLWLSQIKNILYS